MKCLQTLDYTVDATSGAYGIANIQSALGIILLVLSILSILFKAGYSIYNHIKNKQYKEILTDLEKAKTELTKTKEELEISKIENYERKGDSYDNKD